ncbi:MAG: hypothetical protein ABI837_12690 [Acidobacteriota bacterium]
MDRPLCTVHSRHGVSSTLSTPLARKKQFHSNQRASLWPLEEELMKMTMFEPMMRDAMIRAIDGISKKAAETERAAEGAVTRLLKRWNALDQAEKEQIAAVVVATATTAVGALAALKSSRSKEKDKDKGVKSAVKKVAKKIKKVTT